MLKNIAYGIKLVVLPLKFCEISISLTSFTESQSNTSLQISKIAKEKESQMTTEIVDKLKKYDVKIDTNYKLLDG